MAARDTQQKPDPAIQQNIRRARARAPRGRDARALVIAASLAATLGGWALFAQQDAQALAAAQVATPTAVVAAAPTPIATLTPVAAAPTPTAASVTTAQLPVSVARTRSSR